MSWVILPDRTKEGIVCTGREGDGNRVNGKDGIKEVREGSEGRKKIRNEGNKWDEAGDMKWQMEKGNDWRRAAALLFITYNSLNRACQGMNSGHYRIDKNSCRPICASRVKKSGALRPDHILKMWNGTRYCNGMGWSYWICLSSHFLDFPVIN